MKKILFFLILNFGFFSSNAQSCQEIMDYVKSNSRGITYYSPTSDAIYKVTFHDLYIDYKYYYFAIVCFKRDYSFNCDEYIYQVGSNTKMYYSMNYIDSAGKAFWEYIQPYSDNLGCSPSFN